MRRFFILLLSSFLGVTSALAAITPHSYNAHGQQTDKLPVKKKLTSKSLVSEKIKQQNKSEENPFAITLFRPNYLLPAYYTFEPYRSIYENNTPDQQRLQNIELKFQISFKAPIVRHLFSKTLSLDAAYTQQSWWQAYNNSPFFRETNYEPELFIEKDFYHDNYDTMHVRLLDVGLVHESNGRGGILERSWNRAYVALLLEDGGFIMQIKPWYIFQDSSLTTHNPNIANYLGYGQILLMYQFKKLDVSLRLRNIAESNFSKGAEELTLSYPISNRFRFYVLGFSGYGQSLIEYDHYTNAIAAGFALNDNI